MRTMTMLLLSCLSLLAAEDVHVVTVVNTTAEAGNVITQEFFTRAGQTNLLESTTTRNGVVRSRLYRFYHDGKHAADHLTVPGIGYSVVGTYNGFDLAMTSQSNALSRVILRNQYDAVLDVFVSTNGVLTPVPAPTLREYIRNPAALDEETQGVK